MQTQGLTNPPRMIIAALGVVVAVTLTACGGTTGGTAGGTKSGVPKIEHTADGFFVARVKGQDAAATICSTKQAELAQQLKDLGAPSGSGALVLFQYGNGDPAERLGSPSTPYGLANGAVAVLSPTLTICGVTAK